MRRYYEVQTAGNLKSLRKMSGGIPEPGPGNVLVSVRAVGLNYADLFAIMGLYSATPKGSFIPGLEYCGIVLKSNSEMFAIGQSVIGVTRFGGYDSHIVADPRYLAPLPAGWSFEEGAAFPVQTLTAHYALHTLGSLKEKQTVLIHSAAGGVGLQANRIAKKAHAFTVGVVGDTAKLAVLKQEGFDRAIVRSGNFKADLKEALGGRELNLVLETTGGRYFRLSYDALAPMGRVVAYGSAQFTPAGNRPNYPVLLWKYLFRPRIDPLSMIPANKSVMAFNLIWIYEHHELMATLLHEIDQLNLAPPRVGHTFDFDKAHEALTFFKGGKSVGKIVLTL